jgi:hypothetical protein
MQHESKGRKKNKSAQPAFKMFLFLWDGGRGCCVAAIEAMQPKQKKRKYTTHLVSRQRCMRDPKSNILCFRAESVRCWQCPKHASSLPLKKKIIDRVVLPFFPIIIYKEKSS